MKVNYSIICLFLAVILFSCKEPKQKITIVPDAQKNSLQLENIFGNVKTITIKKYFAVDAKGEKMVDSAMYASHCQYYTKEGNLCKVVITNYLHDTISVRNILYNAQGKMVRDELSDSAGHCMEYTVYENDSRGYRVKEQRFIRDSLMQTLVYKNDNFGNVLEIQDIRPLYTLKKSYKNNEVGLPIRIDEYDPDGNLFKYVTVEYDAYGNSVNRRVFSGNGASVEYTHTQYDAEHRLAKEIYENVNTQIKDVGVFSNYDQNKNWRKQVRSFSGRAQIIIDRTIEYY